MTTGLVGLSLVGLLIMREENDILLEYLLHITQYIDRIYVLDGSDDWETGHAICKRFKEVVWYKRDVDVIQSGERKTDGIRGFVWEAIKADSMSHRYEWVAVLHPDEFWLDDHRHMLKVLDPHIDNVHVVSIHGFIHKGQEPLWEFKPKQSIFDKTCWGMHSETHKEARFFRNRHDLKYNTNAHSRTTPLNCKGDYYAETKLLQCTYRNKEQVLTRLKKNIEHQWQTNDFIMLQHTQNMFFSTLKAPPEIQALYPNCHSFYDMDFAHTVIIRKTAYQPKSVTIRHNSDFDLVLFRPIHCMFLFKNVDPELLKPYLKYVRKIVTVSSLVHDLLTQNGFELESKNTYVKQFKIFTARSPKDIDPELKYDVLLYGDVQRLPENNDVYFTVFGTGPSFAGIGPSFIGPFRYAAHIAMWDGVENIVTYMQKAGVPHVINN
jgi:hypothetical protein